MYYIAVNLDLSLYDRVIENKQNLAALYLHSFPLHN